MMNVVRSQERSPGNWFRSTPDDYPVHGHGRANLEIFGGEFVLGGNARQQRITIFRKIHFLAQFQINERDEDVIPRVELENFFLHSSQSSK